MDIIKIPGSNELRARKGTPFCLKVGVFWSTTLQQLGESPVRRRPQAQCERGEEGMGRRRLWGDPCPAHPPAGASTLPDLSQKPLNAVPWQLQCSPYLSKSHLYAPRLRYQLFIVNSTAGSGNYTLQLTILAFTLNSQNLSSIAVNSTSSAKL